MPAFESGVVYTPEMRAGRFVQVEQVVCVFILLREKGEFLQRDSDCHHHHNL